MKPIVISVLLAGAAGATAYEARLLAAQRGRLDTLRARHARLEAVARELQAATNEPSREPGSPSEASAVPTISAAITIDPSRPEQATEAWLARLQRLKQLIAENPAQRIPEMDLLTDSDLLGTAKAARFETEADRREALAAARTAAKRKFIPVIAGAIRRFSADHEGRPPAALADVVSHLETSLPASVLDRYALLPPNTTQTARMGAGFTEKLPVDADYDSRLAGFVNGGVALYSPPGAWIPGFQENMQQATAAFRAQHYGAAPGGVVALLPYFNPPLDPAQTAKLREAERKFLGR